MDRWPPKRLLNLSAGVAFIWLSACSDQGNDWQAFQAQEAEVVLLAAHKIDDLARTEPIRPLRSADIAKIPKQTAMLGRDLFHDVRLSINAGLSCASCHHLHRGGVDGRAVSVGIGGAEGGINSPSVLNAALGFRQFWDGRAETLQAQAEGPVENPIEMGAKWPEVVALLNQDESLRARFKQVFGESEITKDRVTKAIADFEKTLLTPSAFDRYLMGDHDAISKKAERGYQLFKRRGCVACHQGVNVGGNLYQKFGAIQTYFEAKSDADLGLGGRTQKPEDMSVFKVPSLRNVALTAPYFHNAGAKDLATAIQLMGVMQLGEVLPDEEIELIEAFLHSLTGERSVRDLNLGKGGVP